MKRKFGNFILLAAVAVICLLLLPTEAKAASVEDLTFTLISSNYIESYSVTNCDDYASGELVIPAAYNGLPVTRIGYRAFNDCTSLTSITIPGSVTAIGYCAFSGCTSLTSITIPDSVISIDDYAFSGCTSLTSITIPDSVTSIGGYAFKGCTSLTSITIPGSVTFIGGAAFEFCTSLTSITIPGSVTFIGGAAFSGCTSLTDVYYTGTHSQWCDLRSTNTGWRQDLANATWHFAVCENGNHVKIYTESAAPTCTEDGYGNGCYCDLCGEILIEQEVIPAQGHHEVIDSGYAATCIEEGLTDGKKCFVCGEVLTEQETIPALGHTEETVSGYAATCTETGLTEGVKCSVCGEVLTAQEETPALGHNEVEVAEKAPTCDKVGNTAGVKCSVCGNIISGCETVPALGHTEEIIPGKDATCTETGLTDGAKCSVCGEIITAQEETQKLAHEYDESGKCACGAAIISVADNEVLVNTNGMTNVKVHAFNITGKEIADITVWSALKAADPNFKSYSKDSFTLENGAYVLRVQYKNAEGVAKTESYKVTIDYTPAPVVGPEFVVENNKVSVTDNGMTGIKIYAFNITDKDVADINVWNQLKTADPSFKTYTKSAFTLKNGTYVLRVQYTDAEGVNHTESHQVIIDAEIVVPQATVSGKTVTVDAKGTTVSKIHAFYVEGDEIADIDSWNELKSADSSFKSYKKSQFSVKNSGAYVLRIEYVDQNGIAHKTSQLITAA